MKQSRFSLADVFTVLAALAFGFVCFLGKNYSTLGNAPNNIIGAVFIALLLGGFAMCAKILKRTYKNFNICFIWEMIFLIFFTSFTVFFTCSTFSHFIVVLEGKEKIQNELIASIAQAENMFKKYEDYAENRKRLYESMLKNIVDSKETNPSEYIDYGFGSSVNDIKQIQDKMFNIEKDLFPSNYKEMKQIDSTWLANAQNIIENWKWIGIINVVKEIEQNTNNWLASLVKLSTIRQKGEQANNFIYKLEFNDVKKYFTSSSRPTPFSICCAIMLYVLMLLPYIFSRRSTKLHEKIPARDTDIVNI